MNTNILNQIVEAVKDPPGETELKTQVEKAMEETKPDESPQSSALLKELRRTTGGTKRNWPEGLLVDGKQPVLIDQALMVSQIGTQAPSFIGEPICSDEDFAKLRDIQTRMDAAIEQAKKYTLSDVSAHLFKVRDQIEADVRAGKELPDSIAMPSHESVSRDFRAKQSAYISLLNKITHEELAPLAGPILRRFDRTVEEFMKHVEVGDRFVCDSYGLEYHPSVLWKACALVALRYSAEARLPKAWVWTTPRTLLEGIIEI